MTPTSARSPGEILAIDLGTLSVKVGVFDRTGALLALARRSYGMQRPRPGWVEQDPEEWWAAVVGAAAEVLQPVGADQLRAVCVGGQGPTLVLVDEAGRPTRPAISWSDQRSAPQRTRLAEQIGFDPSYSLVPRLSWLTEHEPQTVSASRWALQAWDFVAFRLGGHAAASTIAGDVVWRTEWLDASGLDDAARRLLPIHVDAAVAYAQTAGRWGAQLGLPDGIPIVGGVNDGIGSLIGAAGTALGRATDPGGAAGGLALVWNTPVSATGVDCWPGWLPGTSILGGAFAAGGSAVDWWAAATGGDVDTVLRAAEQAPPGAGGLVFLPFLAGERNPLWDAEARGAFLGLSFDHGPTHLARAVVESSGYSLRLLTDALASAGATYEELRVSGGQAQSRFWNQVKADVLGCVVAVPHVSEAALMGDAICAAVGAGFYADTVSAGESMVRIVERLNPSPATRGLYDSLFGVYRDAYTALKPLSARLGSPPTGS